MAETSTQDTAPDRRRGRTRSPNYPAFDLPTAIDKAYLLFEAEGKHSIPIEVAVTHWGYSTPRSSSALSCVGALNAFGLLDSKGSGENRQLKLSERALDIILDEELSPRKRQAIWDAAFDPAIHAELWSKYKDSLPSNAALRSFLLREKGFNPKAVESFIDEYKATLVFALPHRDSSDAHDDSSDDEIECGDRVQWESQGVAQFQTPRLVLRIQDGYAWVEGTDTGLPIDQLSIIEKGSDESRRRAFAIENAADLATSDTPLPTSRPGSVRYEVFSLESGEVAIHWPVKISQHDFEDIEGWLPILMRKIGRCVTADDSDGQVSD